MQGDTGCGERSVWWRGRAGEDLGVGRPAGWLDNHGRRQRRGHQGNTVGRCFDRTMRVGFCCMRLLKGRARGVLGLLKSIPAIGPGRGHGGEGRGRSYYREPRTL